MQKKIMEKLNRAQKCSILGPQNLGSRGGPGPRSPLGPHLLTSSGGHESPTVGKQAVRILLEYFLVHFLFLSERYNISVSESLFAQQRLEIIDENGQK